MHFHGVSSRDFHAPIAVVRRGNTPHRGCLGGESGYATHAREERAGVVDDMVSALSQAWASWKTAPGVALLAVIAFAVGIFGS